jgi:hypothetical protein
LSGSPYESNPDRGLDPPAREFNPSPSATSPGWRSNSAAAFPDRSHQVEQEKLDGETVLAARRSRLRIERTQGIISAHYQKDATDPRWKDDQGFQDYLAFMQKYVPNVDIADSGSYSGYNIPQTFVQVIKQCGDDLTRENVMRQAANLHDLALPMLLPGIKVNTSPTNFFPVNEMQLVKFEGDGWVLFGDVTSGM